MISKDEHVYKGRSFAYLKLAYVPVVGIKTELSKHCERWKTLSQLFNILYKKKTVCQKFSIGVGSDLQLYLFVLYIRTEEAQKRHAVRTKSSAGFCEIWLLFI